MTANLPNVVEPVDAELLRRYRAGDAASFTQLYERHRLGLFRFLLGLCGDHAIAEEVFQDTWMSLIRSESMQREAAVLFKTWLYQIARNRLIDHWRRYGKRQQREDVFEEQLHDQPSSDPDPERQLSLSQDQARIQAALDDLPAEQREVFLLRAHAELELHEIAELTHTPAETVKSRLRYAMQKLRRLLSVAEEGITMNDHPRDLERDEALLRHVRQYDRQQPSSALDARILAAAAEAAKPQPEAQSAWQRLLSWLAGASGRRRWSAAFGCLAVLGLGLGLSLKTLEQIPPTYDAPPAAMQRKAPAPMALQVPPSPAENSVMAEATEAPKIVARMAAKTAPLPRDVLTALREIDDLRARGEGREAEQRVERLKDQYPDLDVEAELSRLPQP